jgi:hypothetical protein
MDDKVIVTNINALKSKYGTKGVTAIRAAVKQLISADSKRGLKTRLIGLDDTAAMKKLKAPVVTKASDPKQNKAAIDAVFKKLRPDYLMILGSTDVVPHQDLKNPVFSPPDDPDQHALGDLPYACDAPYSRKPENFTGPTRVLGRLPDLTGATEPSYLTGLLKTAATWKQLPFADYAKCLGISAKVWSGSTTLSLENMFGTANDLQLSPARGPNWSAGLLGRRVHFINCHGAEVTPQFFGQSGKSFPVSHEASLVSGKISEGTIASVECCYGAQLYDSFTLGNGQSGICNTYLGSKAYGFLGSTTIAYGPADGNGAADLICQFFVLQVLGGASLGRAALEAQQQFVASSPQLDPTDLKTLAQFILLGDPSIHPVAVPSPEKALQADLAAGVDRAGRREQLSAKGRWLAEHQPCASTTDRPKRSSSLESGLKKIAAKVKLKSPTVKSFKIKRGPAAKNSMAKAVTPTAFHVMMGVKPMQRARTPQLVAVVAKEVAGRIVSFRELHRR